MGFANQMNTNLEGKQKIIKRNFKVFKTADNVVSPSKIIRQGTMDNKMFVQKIIQ
jgi:hypothetical protein